MSAAAAVAGYGKGSPPLEVVVVVVMSIIISILLAWRGPDKMMSYLKPFTVGFAGAAVCGALYFAWQDHQRTNALWTFFTTQRIVTTDMLQESRDASARALVPTPAPQKGK